MCNEIGGIFYPKRKLKYKDKNTLNYIFEFEDEENLEIEIEGISEYRFLFADEEELIVKKNDFTLAFSKDKGKSWYKEKVLDNYKIYQIYKISNGNYLVGTIGKDNLSYVFLLDNNLNILAKNQLGNMCWHSQNAIDENNEVLMFAEYQNFEKNASLPKEVCIYRSKDKGFTWEKVFSLSHPKEIRHWHTLKNDPFHKNIWIATSGDTSYQSRWFKSEDNGESWIEITDKNYFLEEFPEKSQSSHRTTTFCIKKDSYYYATDDLMGSVKEYFLGFKGKRKSSSKFYKASKTNPTSLKKLSNLGIHARCMIDVGKGYIFMTEGKYVSFNSQVFYVSKKKLDKVYFLFNIYANRRHSGCGSMNSKLLKDNIFYTYTANKTFQYSKYQTLKWQIKYHQKNMILNYDIKDFVRFDEHLWFLNKIDKLKNITFFDNNVILELENTDDRNIFYMLIGDEKFNSLKSKELFNIENYDELVISVHLKEKKKSSQVSIFIQQYDDNDKIYSESFLLKEGDNKISFHRNSRAKYLKILFRIASNEEDVIKMSNLSIQEVDKLKIDFNKYQNHSILLNTFKVNMLSYIKDNTDKLVVFFNGAVDVEKTPFPVFQRWSWLERLPFSSIIIEDPTIEKMKDLIDSKTYIGWYQGDKREFILEKIVEYIENLIKKLNIKKENVIFYGSSAGGFASLISASILKGSKACVVNPQVNILHYHKKYVNDLLKYLNLSKDELEKMKYRFDAIKYFEYKNHFPEVFYKQNKLDKKHYIEDFLPFKKEYVEKGLKNKLYEVIINDERGHSAIPLFDEALDDINETFKIFNKKKNKKIGIKYFSFSSNESYLNNFKPRKDVPVFELKFPLDWSIDPFNDRNWCFNLHAWRMLDKPLIDFEKSKNEKILKEIINIMKDWYNFSLKKETNYTWYDMSTGLRSLKLAFLINRSEYIIEEDIKFLLELGKMHLNKLMNQKISMNNHGIFQLHGLLMLAWVFNDKEKISYAIEEMEELVKQQFNEDGWHSENSDKYHWFVLNIFNRYLSFEAYKDSKVIKKIITLAENNKKWTVFPNNESLMIGDSEYSKRKINVNISTANLEVPIKYFKNSGYLFIRSKFDEKNAYMLFFKTAFKNKTHAHSDDFNILLYEYDKTILVDGGQYAYCKDKARGYVMSSRAHNILSIDNIDYRECGFYESALEYCKEKNGIYEIKSSLYRKRLDVTHDRFLIYKPRNFLIVIDKLTASKKHSYTQFWHFNQDLEIEIKNNKFFSKINEDIYMEIEPYVVNLDKEDIFLNNDKKNISLIKAQKEPELQGWRSLEYRKLIANYALENNINAQNALLITKFFFKKDEKKELDLFYDKKNDTMKIFSKENNLELSVKL